MPNYLHVAGGLLDTSQPWSVRIYSTSSGTEATVQSTWDTAFAAAWNTASLLALTPTTTSLTYTYSSTMDANWHQTTKTQNTHAIAGTATQALPPHLCEVVSWSSALANRLGRGRWYWPALGSGALATGGLVLSATAVGDMVTAINALLTDAVPTLGFCILHRHGSKGGISPFSTTPITGGKIGNRFVTQRRRDDKATQTYSALTY